MHRSSTGLGKLMLETRPRHSNRNDLHLPLNRIGLFWNYGDFPAAVSNYSDSDFFSPLPIVAQTGKYDVESI